MTILQLIALAPVPGKPIRANRGLNLANPGLKFILRLDSVPESTINTNLGINEGLNLIHLARSINSLIGGKLDQNKQNGGLKFCDIVSSVE